MSLMAKEITRVIEGLGSIPSGAPAKCSFNMSPLTARHCLNLAVMDSVLGSLHSLYTQMAGN